MTTDDITYNQASGKLYRDGVPFLSHVFMNEAEAEDYLNQVGLQLHKLDHPNLLFPRKKSLDSILVEFESIAAIY